MTDLIGVDLGKDVIIKKKSIEVYPGPDINTDKPQIG